MNGTIPSWDDRGLLPPISPDVSPVHVNRSPFRVGIMDVVAHFSSSKERCDILHGLLNYRQLLHEIGIKRGFQWIDGSFTENVEITQDRPPNDIDVVSFIYTSDINEIDESTLLKIDHAEAKKNFKVDSYFVEYDKSTLDQLVLWATYWYSMWSHKRNLEWKGFLQIDLAPDGDSAAREWLAAHEAEREVP